LRFRQNLGDDVLGMSLERIQPREWRKASIARKHGHTRTRHERIHTLSRKIFTVGKVARIHGRLECAFGLHAVAVAKVRERLRLDEYQPFDSSRWLIGNDELVRPVGSLSEEEMRKTPDGSDWSIRDHVAHFYDTQEMLDTRVDLMLKHDNPELAALAVYELATEADRHPASTRAMLARFRDKRARCIARLEALPLKDLWRPGRHPEFGQLTILRQAAYLAFHEQTHLPEIEMMRQRIVRQG